mmetsp:Transcript_71043/g.219665  ORF Transcript_71043/g.219665 Transcript_71043/m.219665 type:complete len:82 (+) Transcript_71043:136-381(+)
MPKELAYRLVPSRDPADPGSLGAMLGLATGFVPALEPQEPEGKPTAGPWTRGEGMVMAEVKIEGATFSVPMHHGRLYTVGK